MKIVIIHWTLWNPNENRFPWLKVELEKLWHQVWIPKLSTPENQTPKIWCDELQAQVPFVFDEETVLIGHSLWATYLLHILDIDRMVPIKHAIFVSWFINKLWIEEFDILNKPFLDREFDFERVKKNKCLSWAKGSLCFIQRSWIIVG